MIGLSMLVGDRVDDDTLFVLMEYDLIRETLEQSSLRAMAPSRKVLGRRLDPLQLVLELSEKVPRKLGVVLV